MAAAAVKIKLVEGYYKLILKRELTILCLCAKLLHSQFICILGRLLGLPFQFNAIALNL